MESFWEEEASKLSWHEKWHTVLDSSNPNAAKWFVGGKISFCYNAVDRHAIGENANKTAIIYESPGTNTSKKVTYKELKDSASLLAGALVHHGIQQGDIVLAYLPNMLEEVLLYLASSRIGAIFCCVTDGTALTALTERIGKLKPKLIFTTSYSIVYNKEMYYKGFLDEALENCQHKPTHCIVIQRDAFKPAQLCKTRDITWAEFEINAKPMDCVFVDSNHPLFICYTSGTTSTGKGMVFETGPVCVGIQSDTRDLMDGSDVWFPAVSLGWIIAISVSITGTLLLGKTILYFEGDALSPNAGNYYRIVTQHDIDVAVIPTEHFSMIAQQDAEGYYAEKYNVKNQLRIIYVSGAVITKGLREYVAKYLGPKVDVQSKYGQTETGRALAFYPKKGLKFEGPIPDTYVGVPLPFFQVKIVDDECNILESGTLGNIVVKLPLPPGSGTGIYKDNDKYQTEYLTRFKGYHDLKDCGMILPNGGLCVHGRSDGLVKVGTSGSRVNLLDIESAILTNPLIREVAIVCVNHEQYTQVPVALYTSEMDLDRDNSLKINFSKDLEKIVVENIGSLPEYQFAFQVKALPKSAMSGKITNWILSAFAKKNFPVITNNISYEDNWNLLNETLAKANYCIT